MMLDAVIIIVLPAVERAPLASGIHSENGELALGNYRRKPVRTAQVDARSFFAEPLACTRHRVSILPFFV